MHEKNMFPVMNHDVISRFNRKRGYVKNKQTFINLFVSIMFCKKGVYDGENVMDIPKSRWFAFQAIFFVVVVVV